MTTPAEREAAAREALVFALTGCRECAEYQVLCGPEHERVVDAYRASVAETVRGEADERCARLRARDAEIAKVRNAGEAVAWKVEERSEVGGPIYNTFWFGDDPERAALIRERADRYPYVSITPLIYLAALDTLAATPEAP